MDVFQDWRANGQLRIRIALAFFRLAQGLRKRLGRHNPVAFAATVLHHAWATVAVGCELPVSATIGPRFTIWHGFGLVLNSGVVLGADVSVRHGVTIGGDGRSPGCPVIGDGVEIGTGASVLGSIRVGAGARIGAHALVVDDVPPGGRAVGHRAEIREASAE